MRCIRLVTALAVAALPVLSCAQLSTAEEKGVPSNSAFGGGDIDLVNLQNGNLHINIPIYSSTQRGGVNFKWALVYDTQIWAKTWIPNNCGTRTCNPLGAYSVHAESSQNWRFTDPTNWGISNRSDSSDLCDVNTRPLCRSR
jgi:hypothetical protein